MTKRYKMLIKTDGAQNNNKFYELKLEDDDQVIARYGRVGATGVTESKGYGEATFDKVLREKTSKKKGYSEVDIVTSGEESKKTVMTGNIAEIAKRDITANNPELAKLIDKLAQINRHQLLEASGGQIDIVDGQVKTPLGLVSLDAIEKAKDLLIKLESRVEKNKQDDDFITILQNYLQLIPQKVPARRGWHENFFPKISTFEKQNDLLEQLEASVKDSIENQKLAAASKEEVKEVVEIQKVFGYSLEILDDKATFDRINKFFKETSKSMHVSSKLKLKRVYILKNELAQTKFQKHVDKVGNVMELWHGTRAYNLLSILKTGLIIPKSNGSYTITGRMFGDGLYFSDQSTKSLNYSQGYWSGSKEDNCFMFLADVAMGKTYTPNRPTGQLPSGYDSMFAKANQSGVMNNEMIVYNIEKANLKFLCEFDSQ